MTQRYPDPFGPPWKFSWWRLIFTWDGGFLQMFWVEWFVATFLCSICILITYLSLRHKDDAPQEELRDGVEKLLDATTFIARRFQAAVALMLGFYSIQNIGRLNEVRNVHGGVMTTINAVAMQLSWDIVTPESSNDTTESKDDTNTKTNDYRDKFSGPAATNTTKDENGSVDTKSGTDSLSPSDIQSNGAIYDENDISIDVFRIRLCRWLNLSHAIVVGNLYETRYNAFSTLEQIRDCGLCTETEYHYLKQKMADSGFYHCVPLYWFVELLKDARKKDLFGVTDGLIGAMKGQMNSISSALNNLHRIHNLPLPLSYRQITNLTVRTYMVILLVAACLTTLDDEDNRGKLVPASFMLIVVFAFEYMLFVGWLTVADAIGNPFRSWADEYEWINYVRAINHSSLFLAHGFHCKTKTVEDLKGRVPVLSQAMREWHDVCIIRVDDKPKQPFRSVAKKLTGFAS